MQEHDPMLELKEAYKRLGLGDFSATVLEDILKHGDSNVLSNFNRHLNELLDKNNIQSTLLRGIFINSHFGENYRFKAAVSCYLMATENLIQTQILDT